jgi:hypothetical protein
METLSELGVLFLLYEQGLELSLDRLKVRGNGLWLFELSDCGHWGSNRRLGLDGPAHVLFCQWIGR